ncbi:unnamed protein product [Penicillium salamii]|nr:unnamed protein product [Penicillium salamii]
MACVKMSHSSSTRVPDPTTALKEALMKFEVTLTEEQKRLYQVSATKPDVASVIAFVAEIDANNNSTIRRCVAPRLCTFLEATQQFSDVVGTFISSNPQIAALVWGGVKTAILTASNITSYFGKVTSMIMDIGKSCPTYQQFGQIYPGCVGLQRELCEYYAAIIQLCTKIIEVSRRPPITQTLSSIFNPFESEFRSSLDKLNQVAKDIKLQISLASMQANEEAKKLLKHDSQNNAAFRKLTKTFQKETQKEHTEAHRWRLHMMKREAAGLRSSIRNNLSTINYVKPWKQAMQQRVPSTAEWLLQEPLFHDWQDDQNTAILWCPGTMGVGKTVLISNVVAQLHTPRNTKDVISYYFCRADNTASLSARNIMGSLARQILDSQIKHAQDESLQRLYKDSHDLNTAEVVDFVLSRLHDDKTYYLAIDGLDECEIVEVRKVAQSVAQLCNMRVKNFKVLYTGRPELENELFRAMKPKYKITMTETKVDLEMNRFIDTTLGLCLEDEQLKIGDPRLILKISEALQMGAKGMFLWTRLFIEELCEQGSDSEILDALKHPPRGLSEIFDRKLSRVRKRKTGKDAFKILQFCGVMKRPLTAMEYQEVLGLSPGQKSLDREKLPNDMNKVIGDCCGLTFIDEEDGTVHYVHHSVKQHLFAMNCRQPEEFNMEKLDWQIGVLCMTYLDFTDFKRQLTKVQDGSNTPIRPVQLGISPFGSYSSVTGRMALRLLSYRQQLRHLSAGELERKAQQILGDKESSRLEMELQSRGFHFLEYARNHWINHLTNPQADHEDTTWPLFCRCVEGNDIVAYRPWESAQKTYEDRNYAPRTIQWVLSYGHYYLLLYHVRRQSHLLTEEVKRHILRTSTIHGHQGLGKCIIQQGYNSSKTMHYGLFYAAREGCNELLASLLQVVGNVDTRVCEQTALQVAAEGGHLEVVERLLTAKSDVNTPAGCINGRTALQAAAEGGHLDVLERLLAAKANVNAPAGYRNGRTALQAAAEKGHLEVVERLLAAKANVNAPASYGGGRTALQAAVEKGYLEVVERLLVGKANVNAPAGNSDGRTALQAAAEKGHFDVVERLLAANADVNAPAGNSDGRTALQAAAEKGHLDVVERLLAAKANVNAPARYRDERTALQAAAEGGHLDVVERLLAAKANVNAPASYGGGRTPLQAAAEGGYLKVVELLLAAKADVNAPASDINGRTVLQAAAEGGHLEVVEQLLTAKSDVNTPAGGEDGRTALQAAAEGGHFDVVERLLTAKATVNAPAGYKNGRTALQAAAEGGHLDVVERLLAANADANAPAGGEDGRTALQAAAEGGHLDVLERLLAAKADVNAPVGGRDERTALLAAAEKGHLEVVERLLVGKADVNAPAGYLNGRTALQAAAERGHLEVVERLLAANADANAPAGNSDGRTALQAAATGGYLEIVKRLLAAKANVNAPARYWGGRTSLQAAAEGGYLKVVELLLAAKADVNAPAGGIDGRTALQAAVEGGHFEVVERLLTAKAHVDEPNRSEYGDAALLAAAEEGYIEVVDRLLSANANVNARTVRSFGCTPLQAAAKKGYLEVVEQLLLAKANVNLPAGDRNGRTALQAAAAGGHLKVVELLLGAKADVNARAGDTIGCTALQAAAERGHLEVVECLRQAGASTI